MEGIHYSKTDFDTFFFRWKNILAKAAWESNSDFFPFFIVKIPNATQQYYDIK